MEIIVQHVMVIVIVVGDVVITILFVQDVENVHIVDAIVHITVHAEDVTIQYQVVEQDVVHVRLHVHHIAVIVRLTVQVHTIMIVHVIHVVSR